MLTIQGKVNTAVCYATVIEDMAIEQIRRMCDYALTEGSRIRIMPDVHAGAGCTVGTTMTVTDKACPNIVGVDIGCGMYTVHLQETDLMPLTNLSTCSLTLQWAVSSLAFITQLPLAECPGTCMWTTYASTSNFC